MARSILNRASYSPLKGEACTGPHVPVRKLLVNTRAPTQGRFDNLVAYDEQGVPWTCPPGKTKAII